MSHERGPASEYEVVWKSGHIDRVTAHQVMWTGGVDLFGGAERTERVRFHAEVDGHWMLMLDALADEIATVRNVTYVRDEL